MPDIPDLSEMSPDRWLSKMQEVREELVGEFVRVLGECDDPGAAAEAFGEVFEAFALPEEGEPSSLLAVRVEEGALVFERESTGDERVLRPAGEGGWALADGESEIEGETEEVYRELAGAVLELLTWWSKGAFVDKVGRPRDFVDPSDD